VPSVDPAVARSIEAAIERDFLLVLKSNLSKRRPADLIAGLLNNISSETRDGFLGYLESQDQPLARAVQRIMFTFEDIHSRLHGRDVAGVLREVEEADILKALKFGEAQGSATVAFIIENLPRRLSERYVEEMAAMEELTSREGEAAQIELTRVIQARAKAGAIQLIEREATGV
jgi:flagellar motor switch protein FliG